MALPRPPAPGPSRPSRRGRPTWRRRAGWLGRVLAAVTLVALSTGVATPSGAATSGAFTMTISKQRDLGDGEVVNLDLTAPTDSGVNSFLVGMCRPGLTYDTTASLGKNVGNCVSAVGSGAVGAGDAGLLQGGDVQAIIQRQGHVQIPWAVGTGTAEWTSDDGNQQHFSLTCDQQHPCTLVVMLQLNGSVSLFAFDLTFRSTDLLAGCGSGTGMLAASHPFRLGQLWSTETGAACQASGTKGALTKSVANGEDDNLRAFAAGTDDLTFTGVGFHDPYVLAGGQRRAAVPVPIGLNAAVFALGGGTVTDDGTKVPYVGLKFTVDEVGQILSGGMRYMRFGPLSSVTTPRWGPIVARNPVLSSFGETAAFLGLGEGGVEAPFALANGDTASWVLTNHLKQTLGAGWREYVLYDSAPGQPRGADLALGVAKPAYLGNLFNGVPAMRKALQQSSNPRSLRNLAPMAVATDLVSARALSLEPASISTTVGGSSFVAPTPETMAAAVPTMVKDDQGMRFSNPAAADDGVYAMTFVEYALVPADALADPCKQQNLHTWLDFLTGPGQQLLPAGMVPLTPVLSADAKEAIAKIPTGVCPGGSTSATAFPGGSGAGGGSGSGSGSGSGGGAGGGSGAGRAIDPLTGRPVGESTVSDAARENAATSPTTAAPEVAVVAPEFAGNRTAAALVTVGAMLGLALLTTLAALYSSGKLPWHRKPAGGEPEIIALDGHAHDVIELR